jgi:hypothetical protein
MNCFGVTMPIFLLLLVLGNSGEAPYDADRYSLHAVDGIEAPTGILFSEGSFFLTAGVLAARPGLYRLHHDKEQGYRAGLLQILPRQDIQGLARDREGHFRLASMRHFTTEPDDWVSEVITLDGLQYRPLSFTRTNVESRCTNGTYTCGLTAVLSLQEERILAVSLQRPARLFTLRLEDGKWMGGRGIPLLLNGEYVQISAATTREGKIYLLLRDRWMLATLDLAPADNTSSSTLGLSTYFDFAHLRKDFRVGPPRFMYQGLADGFTIGPDGGLYIVLNNQGYLFEKSPDKLHDRRPKLLVFPPKTEKK